MFHTGYVHIKEEYHCYECDPVSCEGHVMELKINNTAGVAELVMDGKSIMWLGCEDAERLYSMLDKLKNNK